MKNELKKFQHSNLSNTAKKLIEKSETVYIIKK